MVIYNMLVFIYIIPLVRGWYTSDILYISDILIYISVYICVCVFSASH